MSEDPIPSAPSSISRRTSARMRSISSGVGARSSCPMTYSRTVAAPMYDATLGAMPFFSR